MYNPLKNKNMEKNNEHKMKVLERAEAQSLYGGYVDPTWEEKMKKLTKEGDDGVLDPTPEKPDFKCY